MVDSDIKHLEFIQENIARMNQCSFQIKNWSITIVSALLTIYVASRSVGDQQGNILYIYVAIIPTFLFWVLDSYYLQQERKFRAIYNDLISVNNDLEYTIEPFSMPLNKYEGGKYHLVKVMLSKTEVIMYISIMVMLLFIAQIISNVNIIKMIFC